MTLIGINVGIYLLQLAGGASINANRAGSSSTVSRCYGAGWLAKGEWYRLLTAAFLHDGPIHLGLNMLALWWIGRPLEDYLGPVRYLLLYLVSGLAGSAGRLAARTRPRSPSARRARSSGFSAPRSCSSARGRTCSAAARSAC